MIWRIDGVHGQSGQDMVVDVEAANETDALHIAKGRGLFVSKVTPVTLVIPASIPSPVPASTVPTQSHPARPEDTSATGALVLASVSMVAWCLPILGFPISLVALMVAISDHKQKKRGAEVAIVLSAIALLFSIGNAIWGAILFS